MSEPTSPVPVSGVSHVSIGVSDMERSIAFYRDVFGWEQIFDQRFVIDPDGQGIEMCEYVCGGPVWGGAYR